MKTLLFAVLASGKLNVTFEQDEQTLFAEADPSVGEPLKQALAAAAPDGVQVTGFQVWGAAAKVQALHGDGTFTDINEPPDAIAALRDALVQTLST